MTISMSTSPLDDRKASNFRIDIIGLWRTKESLVTGLLIMTYKRFLYLPTNY
jgi:hypothetical protein